MNACVNASELSSQFKILRLSENMRLEQLPNDPQAHPSTLRYPDFLLRVCEGRLEEMSDNDILLPSYVNTSETLSMLRNSVFKGIEENWDNKE